MRVLAVFISTILHPLLYLSFVAYAILLFEPHTFGVNHWTLKKIFLLKVLLYTVVLPLITILMLRALKFIKSVQMTDKNDRIVPLISCMIFYIWFYVNIKNNPGIPVDYILFVLGATIGLSVSFIMTIFEKISIHAIGVGGFLIYILTLIFHFGYEYAVFEIFGENYRTHIIFLFLVCIIVSGLILSFRLLLRTHSSIQIYLGLFAGIISQLLANRILL